jgi:NADH-ubiquinone oxidoreductase chain 3
MMIKMMNSKLSILLIVVLVLVILLLGVNSVLSEHKPDKMKSSQFECGFSSFREMSRMPFRISYYIYALLFLLFDLEILLIYPYVVSSYNNSGYGMAVLLVFFILLTIGFVYELGKKALVIGTRQIRKESSKASFIKIPLKNSFNYWHIIFSYISVIKIALVKMMRMLGIIFVFIASILTNIIMLIAVITIIWLHTESFEIGLPIMYKFIIPQIFGYIVTLGVLVVLYILNMYKLDKYKKNNILFMLDFIRKSIIMNVLLLISLICIYCYTLALTICIFTFIKSCYKLCKSKSITNYKSNISLFIIDYNIIFIYITPYLLKFLDIHTSYLLKIFSISTYNDMYILMFFYIIIFIIISYKIYRSDIDKVLLKSYTYIVKYQGYLLLLEIIKNTAGYNTMCCVFILTLFVITLFVIRYNAINNIEEDKIKFSEKFYFLFNIIKGLFRNKNQVIYLLLTIVLFVITSFILRSLIIYIMDLNYLNYFSLFYLILFSSRIFIHYFIILITWKLPLIINRSLNQFTLNSYNDMFPFFVLAFSFKLYILYLFNLNDINTCKTITDNPSKFKNDSLDLDKCTCFSPLEESEKKLRNGIIPYFLRGDSPIVKNVEHVYKASSNIITLENIYVSYTGFYSYLISLSENVRNTSYKRLVFLDAYLKISRSNCLPLDLIRSHAAIYCNEQIGSTRFKGLTIPSEYINNVNNYFLERDGYTNVKIANNTIDFLTKSSGSPQEAYTATRTFYHKVLEHYFITENNKYAIINNHERENPVKSDINLIHNGKRVVIVYIDPRLEPVRITDAIAKSVAYARRHNLNNIFTLIFMKNFITSGYINPGWHKLNGIYKPIFWDGFLGVEINEKGNLSFIKQINSFYPQCRIYNIFTHYHDHPVLAHILLHNIRNFSWDQENINSISINYVPKENIEENPSWGHWDKFIKENGYTRYYGQGLSPPSSLPFNTSIPSSSNQIFYSNSNTISSSSNNPLLAEASSSRIPTSNNPLLPEASSSRIPPQVSPPGIIESVLENNPDPWGRRSTINSDNKRVLPIEDSYGEGSSSKKRKI